MESYLLGVYEKGMPGTLSLKEKLMETRVAGFDYMELSVDESDEKLARLDWSTKEIGDLVAAQLETGIPIKSICLSGHRRFPLGHPDASVRQKSLEIMRRAVSLSARLGVRIIQIAGYDVYYEPHTEATRQSFATNLALSTEMAAREGITLAFETMETEFLNTVEKAMYWVDSVDSPYLQVYPDSGNITNAALQYKTTVLDDLESGRGHISALHLKETKPGIYREVPYGQGHVDFAAISTKAFELGVRLFVGEFWHTGEKNWKDILNGNNQFLRKNLDNAAKQREAVK